MAQKVEVRFIDDLDGSEAEGTYAFAYDGTNYEIDLSKENVIKLEEALDPFLTVARKVSKRQAKQVQAAPAPAKGRNREDTAKIRAWARDQGHQISDRGRVPKTILEAYHAAA